MCTLDSFVALWKMSDRPERINVDEPRWDQSTIYGRLRHFGSITNPIRAFARTQYLYKQKKLLELYKKGEEPKGTTLKDIYRAQAYYGSAFHPDTGELQNLLGRMCFQVPGGTILLGAMLIWYKSTPAVIFWQWVNQSFCALLNYTNRNAKSPMTNKDLMVAYTSAVSGALGVALSLKYYFAKIAAPVLIQRLVPFTAVAVANAINLPLMRQNEMRNGVMVLDDEGRELVLSRWAAYKAITETLISRTILVAPPMIFTPAIMEYVGKYDWFKRNMKLLNIPMQLALTAIFFGIMVPVGCGVYPQRSSIKVETLRKREPKAYEQIKKMTNSERVYFNKGL